MKNTPRPPDSEVEVGRNADALIFLTGALCGAILALIIALPALDAAHSAPAVDTVRVEVPVAIPWDSIMCSMHVQLELIANDTTGRER